MNGPATRAAPAGGDIHATPRTSRGISLHIGLSSVNPLHYGSERKLNSPRLDAERMSAIAEAQGFEKRAVLLDRDATRERVIEEIRAAAGALASGDFFLLTYSGHGGRVPDRTDEEEDRYDETWCLWDRQLLDDELHAEWRRFEKGVRILVVSDSCHSGDVLKQVAMLLPDKELMSPARFWSEAVREGAARLPPSLSGAMKTDSGLNIKALSAGAVINAYRDNRVYYDGVIRRLRSMPARPLLASVRLLAACRSDQKAVDGGSSEENSLFTQELLHVWDGGRFQGDYEDFVKKIGELMPPAHTPQHSCIGAPDPAYDAQRPFTI